MSLQKDVFANLAYPPAPHEESYCKGWEVTYAFGIDPNKLQGWWIARVFKPSEFFKDNSFERFDLVEKFSSDFTSSSYVGMATHPECAHLFYSYLDAARVAQGLEQKNRYNSQWGGRPGREIRYVVIPVQEPIKPPKFTFSKLEVKQKFHLKSDADKHVLYRKIFVPGSQFNTVCLHHVDSGCIGEVSLISDDVEVIKR